MARKVTKIVMLRVWIISSLQLEHTPSNLIVISNQIQLACKALGGDAREGASNEAICWACSRVLEAL